jgi:hypothetical protein
MSVATGWREREGAERRKYPRRKVVNEEPGQDDPGLEKSE